jgi:Protein of unknown function (DUF3631)
MSLIDKPTGNDAVAHGGGQQQTLSSFDRVRLLEDIIDIFRQRNVDRIPTSVLIDSLGAVDDRPWTGMSSANLGDTQKLARLVRPLFIRSKKFRWKERQVRGYERQWFEKALRLLSPCGGALG